MVPVMFHPLLLGLGAVLPIQDAPLTRIAFGSCARHTQPMPIWETIGALDPQMVVLLGDNVYGDSDEPEALKAAWEILAADPGFAKLRESATVVGTWDDHDYGRNDAGREYEIKAASQQLFLDFLGVAADSPRRQREGIYHAEVHGPPGRRVQVISLDTRYHRSPLLLREGGRPPGRGPYLPDGSPQATVLGEEQWGWLEEQLLIPAEVRLVASSIQFASDEHGYEAWANFPGERDRMLELIARTAASGVIFLSGDRHAAEISVLAPVADGISPGYPLYDVTASSFNQWRGWKSEENPHRLGDLLFQPNFGAIEIDWEGEEPRLSLSIRIEDGTTVLRHDLPLRELSGPKAPAPWRAERVERIAFGSCNNQTRPTPLWEKVNASDPELFLFLGDNVYGDTEDMDVLRSAYAALHAQPGFATLFDEIPVLATWDDHDYGANDAGKEYPMRAESQRILLESFGEDPDSPRWDREGVWGSWLLGPPEERVQIILLDLRTHRDPWGRRSDRALPGDGRPGGYATNDDPSATILGEEQWEWLESELRVPARLRLIGSSLQCVSDGHVWECWSMMPHERKRLFDLVGETRANGVVLLSGDTHWGELSRIDPADSGVGYPLWEATSSGLNQAWDYTNMKNTHRVSIPIWRPNFGLVTLDWDRPDPRVRLQVTDGGRGMLEVDLALDELVPPLRVR